jgi:hypothetical protein
LFGLFLFLGERTIKGRMFELQEKLDELKVSLEKEQQILFSLKSIQNFLTYFKKLNFYKDEVEKLLINYFRLMEENNCHIDKEKSTQLGIDYVMKIGYYYSGQLGFKMKMNFSFAIFWGLMLDSLFLVTGFLRKLYYLTIATILMILYWTYLKLFYERNNKVFALRY